MIAENPLGAGVLALAAGAALGVLPPSTPFEGENAGPVRDPVVAGMSRPRNPPRPPRPARLQRSGRTLRAMRSHHLPLSWRAGSSSLDRG